MLDKSRTNFQEKDAGFTLIEIIVVMSLLAAIGALTAFANFDVWRGYTFRGECDLLISVLQKARSQSVNNICLGSSCTDGRPHGVYIQSDKYTIFQGSDWDHRDVAIDEDFEANSKVSSASSTISEVVFSQLSGDASFPQSPGLIEGKIILNEIDGFHSETISINNEGRIDYQ
ncbi:MAG: prepilin-type N-terminal cleavage/methylation domain-containing protein [Candidatus Nealsonbacteria bacterium]|nr:prepilin-type N-terminal cleavage/methylation domain-containing protein [Candidatus Nealsonbacteria bacterium]